ncbi:MAG: hypothetical protein R8J41_14190 [Alphaproteobacteria bacterium]|nr:hypothetical protein [Alphaproteobacteria bacterium]
MKPWLWGNEGLGVQRANDPPSVWVLFLLATVAISVPLLASITAFSFDLIHVRDPQLIGLGNAASILVAGAYAILVLNYWMRRPSKLTRVYYTSLGNVALSSAEIMHFAAIFLLMDVWDLIGAEDIVPWAGGGVWLLWMVCFLRIALPIFAYEQGIIDDGREADPLVEESHYFENPFIVFFMLGFCALIWAAVRPELHALLQTVTIAQ